MKFLRLLKHSQTLVDGAGRRHIQRDRRGVQSHGGLQGCFELSFSSRDSQFKVLEIATRLMTLKKRSAQRPFEFVFVLSDCSLLQAIKKKKPNRVSCDADEITIYSKNQESCSFASSFHRFPLCLCFTGCRMGGREEDVGKPSRDR